ncbi:hypothetical protein [Lacipirellula parvula]|uniref:Uncharacterized protein n=1 Tax=Lacipirellula parvula TaxID=2650471 RepID=A0A5K7X6P5_9BACT|nr:hypothetical protein [Lacipirellula parvula]BBO30401.1 hypothetical protein PLANPX_0013 [Lacipirellula parvula]
MTRHPNANTPGARRPGSLNDASHDDVSPLPREEYVEQAHLFEVLAARMRENMPAQEILESVREEILATTKLPMAVDFMLAELRHLGAFATAMERLPHYFTPFQSFVMAEAENDRQRFDIRVALEILRREAAYRAEGASRQGLFLYQLEVLCRNRMGYDSGLDAIAKDPAFDENWRNWIFTVRRQIGIVDTADLLFVRSEFYHERKAAEQGNPSLAAELIAEATAAGFPPLFGRQEGRIAWANRKKDPLLLFGALHRQLGYPEAPRPEAENPEERLLPVLARRVEQLESRLKLVEEEQRGGIDLNRFYKPTDFDAPNRNE